MGKRDLLADSKKAAKLVRNVLHLVEPLVEDLKEAGTELESPELRLNCGMESMEFTSGLIFDKPRLSGEYFSVKIARPAKARLYSLVPYRPLEGAISIVPSGIAIKRSSLDGVDNRFRLELEYQLEGREAISGLVYTSSPAETLSEESGSEIEQFWLHAEFKTIDWLREIYERIRVEDVDVLVDVSLRDDIKEVISPDLRFEIMMMAKLQSQDRNERARALRWRTRHPKPKFRGDMFKAMQKTQELFQPSRFRRYLSLDGPFRLNSCRRGVRLADLLLPLDLPQSMIVYSSTDLTLEEPAKEGKLIYKKSAFAKKLDKLLKG